MTDHLDDGSLQALLDGELSTGGEREGREHLAVCVDCRGRFVELREANTSLTAALRLLDPVTATGSHSARTIHSSTTGANRRVARWRGIGLARAAGLLLTVTAAASATIPGSPVRGWLMERLGAGPATVVLEEAEMAAPDDVVLAREEPVETGVTVAPHNGELRIALRGVAPEVQLRARLIDGGRGGVYAVGEAAAARFQTAAGAIEVVDVPGGEVRVEIPRSTRAASVTIDGRPYLVKDGDELRVAGVTRDAAEAEILLRVGP